VKFFVRVGTVGLVAVVAVIQMASASAGAADVTLQLPGVSTGNVTVLSPSTARLTGTVDPNGLVTSYHFEYGVNNILGLSTPKVDIAAGVAPAQALADLLDLQPGSSYSYRLVAENSAGTITGPTQNFTTPPLGQTAQPAPAVVSLSTGLLVSGSGVKGKSAKCTITGTKRRDVLKGTSKRDVICGLGGNDRIRGLGGNDMIIGGTGRDRISGGGGRDRLYGNAGADVLRARDGKRRDRVYGGKGRDSAWVNRGDRVSSVERIHR
jgi:Ca2+-binding RTX toxin-like protein